LGSATGDVGVEVGVGVFISLTDGDLVAIVFSLVDALIGAGELIVSGLTVLSNNL
jgi:hypothetical protein